MIFACFAKKYGFDALTKQAKRVKSPEGKYWVARSVGCMFTIRDAWSVPKRQTPVAIAVVTSSEVPTFALPIRRMYLEVDVLSVGAHVASYTRRVAFANAF